MVNVHIDPPFDDEDRRRRLFAGDVIVYKSVPAVADFAAFTRELVSDVFAPDEPTMVHTSRGPDELADILIDFKPRFIHHPESIAHVQRITASLGAAPELTYADVPKLRTAFPVGGIMLFSGDQLHATIPNTSSVTRYSIDFRTVHEADVRSGRGAPRVDVACIGIALRDFRGLADGAGFNEEDVAPYDTEGAEGVKVYVPS